MATPAPDSIQVNTNAAAPRSSDVRVSMFAAWPDRLRRSALILLMAGIVLVAEAHQIFREGGEAAEGSVAPLLKYTDRVLTPRMTAKDAAVQFEKSNSEELAVVDNVERRKVVGLLTEAYLLRRYSEELDKGWKDLTGEEA